jgi:hypothetical protein
VSTDSLIWDFNSQSSNYSQARAALLATNGARTWNNAYSRLGALLSPVNGLFSPVQYQVGGMSFSTIAEAYVQQGVADGETNTTSCTQVITALAGSTDQVVDLCNGGGTGGSGGAGGGGTGGMGTGGTGGTGGMGTGGMGTGGMGGASCGMLPPDKLDSRAFACGTLDDLATALVGMHPADVWLTRVEANLPHAALADDLTLEAAPDQTELPNLFNVTNSKNSPCGSGMAAVVQPGKPGGAARNRLALFGVMAAAVGATVARRRRRPAPVRIR